MLLTQKGKSIVKNVGGMSFNAIMRDLNSISSFKKSTTVTTRSGLKATVKRDGDYDDYYLGTVKTDSSNVITSLSPLTNISYY